MNQLTDAPPRVRHLARERLTLMAFSAATSVTVSSALLLMVHVGR